ncbi:MAG: restriction endonuclease [Candidatus Thiodiazotropha sp.]
MWEFSGIVEYCCNNCGESGEVPVNDFGVNCIGGSERQMGAENIYEILYEFECPNCHNQISLSFEASEYPIEFLNFVINNSTGAETSGEPYIEHLREIYSAEDLFHLYETIPELIIALKSNPELVREITPREFEEVVAEIFRSKGFGVELTKRTRDGGKDIIAISTDALGIKNKYFIECKRHAENSTVGVDIVRALQGVKNTKDGPNKTIIATTSFFTEDARKFVNNEATSRLLKN